MLMLASFFVAMDAVGHAAPLWQSGGWALLAVGACALFIHRQRRAPYPLLPLSVFAEKRFTLAVSASGLAFIGQGLTLWRYRFSTRSRWAFRH
ncbi:hypothetical protein HAALTHF_01980n [Vreelandella aquamarina]|nr:hypothetical protein HAALTHF_01980n [Halomonas axialensis]